MKFHWGKCSDKGMFVDHFKKLFERQSELITQLSETSGMVLLLQRRIESLENLVLSSKFDERMPKHLHTTRKKPGPKPKV